MKKKSRFLQTPIEPFAVEGGLTADQVLARMERISFQGRNLATAHRIWQKMLQDDVTIFLGMAGALSAGGLRMIVAHLIQHRYVDCLVSTGANLYHDLHETRGRHHYVGSPHADDAALAEERVDRVYDTYASEDEFIANDSWIAEFASTLEPKSVIKKLKDKAFAAKVERAEVQAGVQLLGVDLAEHIAFVIAALRPHAEALGLLGRANVARE